MRSLLRALFVLFAWYLCLPSMAQTRYSVTDLGTLGGLNSRPLGINNADVVGWAEYIPSSPTNDDPRHHAFVWSPWQGMLDLGSFGGYFSEATAINQEGLVTGWADTVPEIDLTPQFGVAHAFLWDRRNGLRDINQPTVSGISNGYAINNLGQVAGALQGLINSYIIDPALWDSDGNMQDLGNFGNGAEPSIASGINDAGQVVGSSWTPPSANFPIAGQELAFLWTQSQGLQSLGTLPGGNISFATAINRAGTVVGSSNTLDPTFNFFYAVAFRWSGKHGMESLGTLPYGFFSGANAINSHGRIVGISGSLSVSAVSPGNLNRAVIWDRKHGIRDLNTLIPVTPGWYLREATGINDEGRIIGVLVQDSIFPVSHAVLLTPQAPPDHFAHDVTSHVSIQPGQYVQNSQTGVEQQVTITNSGPHTIHGPISLVLDDLSLDTSLTNLSGYTNYLAPLGSPYINLDLGSSNALAPGQSAAITLQFATLFPPISYNVRVLAGTGGR